MATAYTPGLTVSGRIRHRVRRLLPLQGEVRVGVGDHVEAREVVAETFMPGDVFPLNLANILSMPPKDVLECVLKKEGDRVEEGEVLARTKGLFGMFRSEYESKVSGTIETISGITGQMIVRGVALPVQVLAYLSGEVTEVIEGGGCVIESEVAFIQGIFGIGGEAYGTIRMACSDCDEELTADLIGADMKGCIVVGGGRMHDTAIERACEVGASAVISGGLDDQDLRDFLGYDLGVAITGSEHKGLSLIITEGFGDIAMADRTFELLRSHEGDFASVNGATQIRAGVMRPEILIPLEAQKDDAKASMEDGGASLRVTGILDVGRMVRIIRDPYFGLIGEVSALPSEAYVLDSGSKARILEVKMKDGESVIIPRANVELIEG